MKNEKRLEMHGGVFGGLIPLIILIAFLVTLSIAQRGGTQAFWAGGWVALSAGLLFAKNKNHYINAFMKGMSQKNGIVIVVAWIFAAIFGKIVQASGLVDGILWFGLKTGAQGAVFTVLAFILAMLFSVGTGTSNGTYLALLPVLYPAGVLLGADPTMLAVAILGGGVFGDNLAPVSDTTIASAYTQEATLNTVVRSRFPLAMSASILAIIVLFFVGGGGTVVDVPEIEANLDPKGLVMLISLAVVIISALSKRHVVESLIYGNISAIVLGILIGKINLGDVFSIPINPGESTGLIQVGITSVTGTIVFALFVLAITQVMIESGVMSSFLKWVQKRNIKSPRQAEFSIMSVTGLASVIISASAPVLLIVGSTFVNPFGKRFNLSPERRANVMECMMVVVFFMIPWNLSVILWYNTLVSSAQEWNIAFPSIISAFLNPYSWAMLAVLLFSVITGWRRKLTEEDVSTDISIKVNPVENA
ncbi:Na+/H+ antiporter NhaC family protein [Chengkuizengella sediminis]|uniref:Na+/H+ antiporter NhaC family protein n=1 Tax=Chengkuizengella sediminis TaxID=1885917 RepID=UPI001389A641|nr:Na+/H+ antiporter NhaC family protein [Chengkuizengella sediminis]NDI35299.1 sodium:proton antiporter [Chengkuizengella sediminis]